MRKRNQTIGLLLAAVLLCGCQAKDQTKETTTIQNTTSVETATVPEETTVPQTEGNGSQTAMRDITAKELVSELHLGWNLGNTLDATSDTLDITADATQFERAWGNPYTTDALMDLVVSSGFDVVRIPVSWTNHIYDDGKYTISENWMDRVQAVVDLAYSRGVTVILNIHHEDWNYPYEANYEAIAEEMKAVWTQIGTRFADYNEHLIFEAQNEPRKVGTSVEWTGGDKEGREVVNKTNAVFVETIRGLGGNNAKRILMLPGYAASSTREALAAIRLPENDDKIIVSVHAYTPYNFALNKESTAKDWKSGKSEIDSLMKNLDTLFISKGIPVIIGEFGAMNKDNLEERCSWATYYVSEAHKLGIPCVWWDNNAFSGNGENFGLIRRKGLAPYVQYPELLAALLEGTK